MRYFGTQWDWQLSLVSDLNLQKSLLDYRVNIYSPGSITFSLSLNVSSVMDGGFVHRARAPRLRR